MLETIVYGYVWFMLGVLVIKLLDEKLFPNAPRNRQVPRIPTPKWRQW
jgi:hypothetical protein